jgi:hypothetical protein
MTRKSKEIFLRDHAVKRDTKPTASRTAKINLLLLSILINTPLSLSLAKKKYGESLHRAAADGNVEGLDVVNNSFCVELLYDRHFCRRVLLAF